MATIEIRLSCVRWFTIAETVTGMCLCSYRRSTSPSVPEQGELCPQHRSVSPNPKWYIRHSLAEMHNPWRFFFCSSSCQPVIHLNLKGIMPFAPREFLGESVSPRVPRGSRSDVGNRAASGPSPCSKSHCPCVSNLMALLVSCIGLPKSGSLLKVPRQKPACAWYEGSMCTTSCIRSFSHLQSRSQSFCLESLVGARGDLQGSTKGPQKWLALQGSQEPSQSCSCAVTNRCWCC